MAATSPTGIHKALVATVAFVALLGICFWQPERAPRGVSVDRELFYQEQITPVLAANSAANTAALEALEAGIHARFETYRLRVPAFTEDITGIGNKSKITWEAMKQMTSGDDRKVERHVTGKFEMHVVSGKKLERDLAELLHAFRRDVEANRNRMLVEIDAAVRAEPGFSKGELKVPEDFLKTMEERIRDQSSRAGKEAVMSSGMTLFVSLAAEEAVRRLVVQALTRVGTSMAGSLAGTAAASGGATAAGGAGGGATGSLGGPAGAIIGIAVGLTVGIVIDVVMTDRMEKQLNEECVRFLTNAERELTTLPGGLISELAQAMEQADQLSSASIRQQLNTLP